MARRKSKKRQQYDQKRKDFEKELNSFESDAERMQWIIKQFFKYERFFGKQSNGNLSISRYKSMRLYQEIWGLTSSDSNYDIIANMFNLLTNYVEAGGIIPTAEIDKLKTIYEEILSEIRISSLNSGTIFNKAADVMPFLKNTDLLLDLYEQVGKIRDLAFFKGENKSLNYDILVSDANGKLYQFKGGEASFKYLKDNGYLKVKSNGEIVFQVQTNEIQSLVKNNILNGIRIGEDGSIINTNAEDTINKSILKNTVAEKLGLIGRQDLVMDNRWNAGYAFQFLRQYQAGERDPSKYYYESQSGTVAPDTAYGQQKVATAFYFSVKNEQTQQREWRVSDYAEIHMGNLFNNLVSAKGILDYNNQYNQNILNQNVEAMENFLLQNQNSVFQMILDSIYTGLF